MEILEMKEAINQIKKSMESITKRQHHLEDRIWDNEDKIFNIENKVSQAIQDGRLEGDCISWGSRNQDSRRGGMERLGVK